MLFLNIGLLFGLLAVAIPIIIHLLNRRSVKHVDWGAMQFLWDSMVRRKRRILIEEVLLLVARCLLMTLLALALARPFISAGSDVPWLVVLPLVLLAAAALGAAFALWRYPGWRRGLVLGACGLAAVAALAVLLERRLNLVRFGGGGDKDVAVIIDGSSSMTIPVDGRTNFDRAKEEAEKLVQDARRQTAFSIILAGQSPAARLPAPTTDRREIVAALDELRPAGGGARVLDALALAAVSLAQGYNPAKQIVVITDGHDVGWETDHPARWEFLAQAFRNLPTPPQIVLRRLALPKSFRNVSVAGVTLSREVVGTDRAVSVLVRVENTGSEAVTPKAVTLRVDGADPLTANTAGPIDPGASETVKFTHRFDRPGAHTLTAGVEAEDDLADDNARSVVLTVVRSLPALLVDGNPAGRFLERAAAFPALALAPSAAAGLTNLAAGAFLCEPEIINAPDIASVASFERYRVVILADVPRLPADAARRLERYVAAGGGLIVAPGHRAEPEFYNAWRTEASSPFLPARLTERVFVPEDAERQVVPSLTTFNHPALKLVADAAQSDIGAVTLSAYWRLKEDDLDERVAVGGRLNTGDPLLVERKLGRGAVLMLCAGFDPQGGNLVTRHSFVPFLHEALYYLARSGSPDVNLTPGRGLSLRLTPQGGAAATNAQMGLLAEFFAGTDSVVRAATRVDPVVYFSWGAASPAAGVPAGPFTAAWMGSLVPRFTETYTLRADADDAAVVYVDGNPVVRGRGAGRVELEAGRRHDLYVEFANQRGGAALTLYWQSRSQPAEVIPAACLSTQRGQALPRGGVALRAADPLGVARGGVATAAGDGLLIRVDGDAVPGIYRVQVPGLLRGVGAGMLDAGGALPFTVQAAPEESRLTVLEDAAIGLARRHCDIVVAETLDQVAGALTGKGFGEELWRHLALAALALVLAEIALTRWIAMHRRTGETATVEFEERQGPSAVFRRQLARVRESQTRRTAKAPGSGPGA